MYEFQISVLKIAIDPIQSRDKTSSLRCAHENWTKIQTKSHELYSNNYTNAIFQENQEELETNFLFKNKGLILFLLQFWFVLSQLHY